MRRRFIFRRMANRGALHEAPNPSPDVLPPQLRVFWDDIASQSKEVYGPHADDHDLPQKTAWKAVRMRWKDVGDGRWVTKRQIKIKPMNLPDPGDVVWLGKLIEYVWITPDAEVVKREYKGCDRPDLWWNDDTKTLFSFPGIDIPDSCEVVPQELRAEAEMFKTWSQRKAKCVRSFEVPIVKMYPRGIADSTSYVSDKWHDPDPDRCLRGSKEYIHAHHDGVQVWEDKPNYNQEPGVIMIQGGNLDVRREGIVF